MIKDALDGKIDLIITKEIITRGQFFATHKSQQRGNTPQLWAF